MERLILRLTSQEKIILEQYKKYCWKQGRINYSELLEAVKQKKLQYSLIDLEQAKVEKTIKTYTFTLGESKAIHEEAKQFSKSPESYITDLLRQAIDLIMK